MARKPARARRQRGREKARTGSTPASPGRAAGGRRSTVKKYDLATTIITVEKHLGEIGFPEYRFHPTRKWRFDWAWPKSRLALEVDGGIFISGRHVTGVGFVKDCEKMNEAIAHGWVVVRATPKQVESGAALDWLLRAARWTTQPKEGSIS